MFIGAGQTIFDAHWMLLWLREMNKGRDYATDVAAANEHGDLQCTGLLSQDAMHFEHRVLSAAEAWHATQFTDLHKIKPYVCCSGRPNIDSTKAWSVSSLHSAAFFAVNMQNLQFMLLQVMMKSC